jgi:DNA-binding transcriptional LysR family regulator
MLDAVTLDQLRTFIAAAEEGSFSAAGRKLRRAQSVVSQTVANLEGQFGVKLFDRSRRRPVLTPQGKVLLTHARTVAGDIARLKAHAKLLAGGLESEVSIAVDVMFPMDALTAAVTAFHAAFPLTPLRLYAETLGAVLQTLLDGRCTVGVSGELANVPPVFSYEPMFKVPLIHVTSPQHPLAKYGGPIPASELLHHIQLVLTDRSTLSAGQELGIMSARTWRLADLGAKHAFLRAGLGWGGMPEESVRSDLARGSLVRLAIEDAPRAGFAVSMRAVYRTDAPPGIAARWLIERLKEPQGEDPQATTDKKSRRRKSAKTSGGSAPRAGR